VRGGVRTGVGRPVPEVLLGEQQQRFAVHLEGAAGDRPQGELLLGPAQPLGHVLPAPEHRLQTWRGGGGGRGGAKREMRSGFFGKIRHSGERCRGRLGGGMEEEERQEGGEGDDRGRGSEGEQKGDEIRVFW